MTTETNLVFCCEGLISAIISKRIGFGGMNINSNNFIVYLTLEQDEKYSTFLRFCPFCGTKINDIIVGKNTIG